MQLLDLSMEIVDEKPHGHNHVCFQPSKGSIEHLMDKALAGVPPDGFFRTILAFKLVDHLDFDRQIRLDLPTVPRERHSRFVVVFHSQKDVLE